ncbi:hypothetical protein SAMN06265348_103346 [Pedobacter westerhofensis]|uniref:DUF5672 domain-containing protein n=1 Tax=Pedobacter westerhofensis TaxID=425512 RepID=A0A521C9H9_9SPHI|nr:DUF5672 family protein [Pedobacter westerhofensis]SMO56056.1 hypothetical protein SAMN06265348_103346 [Pedobacter westerhofensis]
MVNTKKACIAIPVYQEKISAYEQISMDQCFRILGNYDIYFVIPAKLEVFIQSNPYYVSGQASYKVFSDNFFTDVPAYNRLLKFPKFYKGFDAYEFLLLYQLDAFVFKDELLAWCERHYDNIGAPLFQDYYDALSTSPIVGQGNGGFCLRNIKACYQAVTTLRKLKFKKEYTDSNRSLFRNLYRYIKHQIVFIYSLYPFQPLINEDRFWAEEIPAVFPGFKVPDPKISAGFSFEVNPEILFETNNKILPFGCHAWWRYNLEFWKPFIQSYGYEI